MLRSSFLILCLIGGVLVHGLPQQLSKAAPFCVSAECSLPDCRCSSTDIPGGLEPNQTPQVVLITFDDAVNVLNYEIYADLLFNRFNPNGCPIRATFFLSHEYNNYSLVHDLYSRGYEIASHSITHRPNSVFWLEPEETHWEKEIVDMRSVIAKFANIPASEIKGMRAPFLLMGGDEMFSVLERNNFEWDCTWSTRSFIDPGMWPYTLKYRSFQDCQIGYCPINSFPNMWVVPLVDHTDVNNNPCAMLDTCAPGNTSVEVANFLEANFLSHYNGNRSPFGLFLHAAWLENPEYLAGYKMFLDKLSNEYIDSTYFVTISQLLEWVKNPLPLGPELDEFPPWGCDSTPPKNCATRNCYYSADFTPFASERIMSMCGSQCPPFYPWYENIYGANPPTPWTP